MRDRVINLLVLALVGAIAAIAFWVSFDAISAYAARVGAFPARMAWAAPLLVDTWTVAAGLVIFARSGAGVARMQLVYPWALVAAGSTVSVAVNIAHAPAHPAARLLAALPPVALLASLELVMGEARRLRETRGSAAGPRTSRALVRDLLATDPDTDTAKVMAVTGLGPRRAQELLKAESNGHREGAASDRYGHDRPPVG